MMSNDSCDFLLTNLGPITQLQMHLFMVHLLRLTHIKNKERAPLQIAVKCVRISESPNFHQVVIQNNNLIHALNTGR